MTKLTLVQTQNLIKMDLQKISDNNKNDFKQKEVKQEIEKGVQR